MRIAGFQNPVLIPTRRIVGEVYAALSTGASGKGKKAKPLNPNDPVGFGKYGSNTYLQLYKEHPSYCEWVKKTAVESDSPHWRLVRLANWLVNVQEAELLATKEEKSPKKEKTSRGSHPLRLRTTPTGSQESARDKDGPVTEKEEKLYQQVSEMQDALKNAIEQIAILNQEKQVLEHEARNQQGIHKSRRET